jgi:hypothetical protein
VAELRQQCTVSGLKAYARLARRNGMTRSAGAARTVVALLEQTSGFNGGVEGSLGDDKLLRDLLALASAGQSGRVRVETSLGAASILFRSGEIVDAEFGEDRGREALKEILALREGRYAFDTGAPEAGPRRIADSTGWVLTEIMDQLTEERRVKHLRPSR